MGGQHTPKSRIRYRPDDFNKAVAETLSDLFGARNRLINDRPIEVDWSEERFREPRRRKDVRDDDPGLLGGNQYRT